MGSPDDFDSVAACEAIVRNAEINGVELFEKYYVKGDEIVATVICVVGPNASEVTAMIREWAHSKGLSQTRE